MFAAQEKASGTRTQVSMGGLLDPALQRVLGDARVAVRTRDLFDTTLAVLAHARFEEVALAAVNQLAQRHRCTLVQLGWLRRSAITVCSRSSTAWHDKRAATVQLAGQAMDEAVDSGRALHVCNDGAADAAPALRAYARHAGAASLVIATLCWHEHAVGALMFERAAAFDAEALESIEAAALLLGPVLALAYRASRGLLTHAGDSAAHGLRTLTDSSRPGLKLLLGGLAAALLAVGLVPATHRVTAPSIVEGETQWAAVAPFQGFIGQAHVRAGDRVTRGQPLVELEDRDLQLEEIRWQSDLDVAHRKEREAMAAGQRVEQRLAAAQAAQAGAQLALTQDKLRRAQVTAPFDAIVVQGDLSQLRGAPVEQGKTLFELAPLDAWRVILKVDERDIAHIREGQAGEIALVGISGKRYPITVQRITAVATAQDGRNQFRVEAALAEASSGLSPGMEGVAKVDAGNRTLLWIATHRWLDWMRLLLWEFAP
jgi:multidrug resistance efflux pump